MPPRICCLGHVTLDKITTPRATAHLPGGTAWYFAHAMARLGERSFQLVACLAESERGSLAELERVGVDARFLPSRKSVYFENIYGEDSNNRTQKVLAKADPFTLDGIRDIEGEVFHLGTLLADDFPPEVIRELARRGRVSVDVQGFLRHVEGTKVVPCDWTDKLELIPFIDILKANEHEMESLTGETDPRQAALKLASWGAREVVLTLGDKGSLVYERLSRPSEPLEGRFHEIPVYEVPEVVDATGCGDTYMAGYLYQRAHGAGIDRAGRFAAAMCTLKLGSSGPFAGTAADVERVISENEHQR